MNPEIPFPKLLEALQCYRYEHSETSTVYYPNSPDPLKSFRTFSIINGHQNHFQYGMQVVAAAARCCKKLSDEFHNVDPGKKQKAWIDDKARQILSAMKVSLLNFQKVSYYLQDRVSMGGFIDKIDVKFNSLAGINIPSGDLVPDFDGLNRIRGIHKTHLKVLLDEIEALGDAIGHFVNVVDGNLEIDQEKLLWKGTPDQLGYLLITLEDKDLIELPKTNGKGSYRKLGAVTLSLFDLPGYSMKNALKSFNLKENKCSQKDQEYFQNGIPNRPSLDGQSNFV